MSATDDFTRGVDALVYYIDEASEDMRIAYPLDLFKNDEPQGNQVFCPLKKVIPLVADAMKGAQDETGHAKLFSANITLAWLPPRRSR